VRPAAPDIYRNAPRGEGFSIRSREDVKSAWAAYKQGRTPPDAAKTSLSAPPAKEETPADAGTPREPARPQTRHSAPGDGRGGPASRSPSSAFERKPLFPIGPGAKKQEPRPKPEAPAERRVPPTSGIGKQPGSTQGKRYTPRRLRAVRSSGETDSIDVASLREELGIKGKKKEEGSGEIDLSAVPSNPQQKEIALQAFVRRVVPSTIHHQCLEVMLKKRLNYVMPNRLAREAGCKERDARRVLEDWKAAGIAQQDHEEVFQYVIAPSKIDLALIREFMTLWSDSDWHSKLLSWILEAESR
jgi:hypothetical protein